MQGNVDKRSEARELCIQALYQLEVQGDELLKEIDKFFMLSHEDDLVRQLARKWTRGAWEHVKECDELIAGSIQKWQMSRLSPVDKSILRLSVYQLKFCEDIPPIAIIDEAINLARKYSTEAAPGFVNGVLDTVMRTLKIEPRRGNKEVH